MAIEQIREQYASYCERMRKKDAEIQIIQFEEFKEAMKKSEEEKDG